MVEIHKLTPENYPQWDRYVLDHEQGTPFHLTTWKKAVERAHGHKSHYYYAADGKGICAILPMIHLKSLFFGNILSSVPFAAYGGLLADTPEDHSILFEHASHLAQQLKVDYLELKNTQSGPEYLPETDTYYYFIKELHAEHDLNLKAIPRKQRRMVRVGLKSGLKAIFSNDYLDCFYNIFCANVHRLGTPVFAKAWFHELLTTFDSNAGLMVVEYQGKIISGVLSFYYKDTVLPYYAASLPGYWKYAPNDYQYWSLMQQAVDRGCRRFDFGRSKKGTGHFSYKTHWGFKPRQLHYQYYLNNISQLPELNPLNPRYRWKIEAWKKLPLGLAKRIGPHLVKYIP